MTSQDTVTVGLTEAMHSILQQLKDDGIFSEMRDGYRFGIGLAIAKGVIAAPSIRTRTILNAGSLDPDGSIKDMVQQLFPEAGTRPYRFIERLAEAGVNELAKAQQTGSLRIGEMYRKVREEDLRVGTSE